MPNRIGLSIRIKETLSPDYWVSATQVSHHPVVRHDPKPPLPVSPDHFGIPLQENLKVGLREEELALLACWSASACRDRRWYFKLKQKSNELSGFDIERRLQLLPVDLVVGFLEFTQFVPGTLTRLCTGAYIAYSIDSSDGPWWLGFVKLLFYVPSIISEMTDCVLQVRR